MAEKQVYNNDVYVEAVRKIAVRGLIPGHEGSWVNIQGKKGILERFYHRSDGYTEVLINDMIHGQTAFAVPHLTEIEIRA